MEDKIFMISAKEHWHRKYDVPAATADEAEQKFRAAMAENREDELYGRSESAEFLDMAVDDDDFLFIEEE